MSYGSKTTVLGDRGPRYDEVLTSEALSFVARLDGEFAERRARLLAVRRVHRAGLLAGETLDFLPQTAAIREDDSWRVPPPAPGLVDRRVEITGPPTRKMTVNALNSGADVWLADFEDATSPTWANIIEGQLSLMDALDRSIDFTTPEGKEYRLGESFPTIVVRPRGWHLVDKFVCINGRPVPASLLDFGLYLFHCGSRALAQGRGPYFYLPKLEDHHEARLWSDVFDCAEDLLGHPRGTIRATVLIETITAAFQMDEILFELKEHASGLNAGRWDYIFSILKNFHTRPEFVMPDRADVTMTAPFMRAYTQGLVQTCHRRGAHAIGGMAAAVPSREDPERTARAIDKVRADKQREAYDGFDGSWVAHPALVPVCRAAFDAVLRGDPNQLGRHRPTVTVTPGELLAVARTPGQVTEEGLRANVRVSLCYLDAWLRGDGAAAIDGLMEDAATVEISRSQVWTWLHHGTRLADGRPVTRSLVDLIVDEEFDRLRKAASGPHRLDDARALFTEVSLSTEFPSFFTTSAYAEYLVVHDAAPPGCPRPAVTDSPSAGQHVAPGQDVVPAATASEHPPRQAGRQRVLAAEGVR
jgi:malate synthase